MPHGTDESAVIVQRKVGSCLPSTRVPRTRTHVGARLDGHPRRGIKSPPDVLSNEAVMVEQGRWRVARASRVNGNVKEVSARNNLHARRRQHLSAPSFRHARDADKPSLSLGETQGFDTYVIYISLPQRNRTSGGVLAGWGPSCNERQDKLHLRNENKTRESLTRPSAQDS